MNNFKNRGIEASIPSKQTVEKMIQLIHRNLEELEEIAEIIANNSHRVAMEEKKRLFYLGSLLYEFYLTVEDSMLIVARYIDRWVPYSLDWHERLLRIMQRSLPGQRPPLVSPAVSQMLEKYLYFYLSFERCSWLEGEKTWSLASEIEELYPLLKKDLQVFFQLYASILD